LAEWSSDKVIQLQRETQNYGSDIEQ